MSQSDFEDQQRSFPSSIPVRSPSPDLKNKNRILKTISPTLQVRKQMTPIGIRDSRKYYTHTDENEDCSIHDLDTFYQTNDNKKLKEKICELQKFIMQLTSKSGDKLKNSKNQSDLKYKLAEKDKTINDLKKVITTLSERSQHSESRTENQRIKALEIQNQSLGQLVKKLNRKDHQDKKDIQQKLMQEIDSLQNRLQNLVEHNQQLQQDLNWMKKQKLNDQIEKQNLKKQKDDLLSLEQRNNSLQKQNQRLLKLLTDKKLTLPQITISQQNQIFKLQGEIKSLKQKTAPEKMTISKIKQQYGQSLKSFKKQVQRQVQLEFERMKQIIEKLKIKIVQIQHQIPQIQQLQKQVMQSPIKLAQLSKSYVLQTSDLTTQLKKQSKQKRQAEDKLDQLQIKYDKLLRSKEQQSQINKQKLQQSIVDLQNIKNQVSIDRVKHHEQLQIIKNSYESDIQRLKNKHKQQVQEFKGSTKYQINEVVANYNKQIIVLKGNLNTKQLQIQKLEQDLMNKQIVYKRNLQNIEEQFARKQSTQISRLIIQLKQKESTLRLLKENKQQIQQLGQVRKRSQTELQSRYNDIQNKYSELLSNHADVSTKYTQLLTKYNISCQDLNKSQTKILELSDKNKQLNSENQMIPQLKNRMILIQQNLLNLEQQLQSKNIDCNKLEQQLIQQKNQKQKAYSQINEIKCKLMNFSMKNKTTIESFSRIQTQATNSTKDFMLQLNQITNRIIKIQEQNIYLKRSLNIEKNQVQSMRSTLLKIQKQLKQSQFKSEQLNNDILHIQKRLQLKQKQCEELKQLLEQRMTHTSFIEEQENKDINLQDIQRLKKQFQKVMDSVSNEIISIKKTVIETTNIETYQ